MIYQKEMETNIMTIDSTFWVAVSFFIFFGGLVYLKVPQKINEILDKLISDIKNEIDAEKVGNAFGMFCISRMKDDELLNNLKEFKSMFHEEILQINSDRISKSAPNDEITQQTKEIQSEREVEDVVNRTHDDLTKMMMNLKLDTNSWRKSLRKIGVIQ